MPFTIPNVNVATYNAQAQVDTGDITIMTSGHSGTGTLSGGAVTSSGGMGLSVAAGIASIGAESVVFSSASPTISAADGTNPRFDLVSVNNAGTVSVTTGTPASSPVYPALPANSAILAAVYVPAAAGSISSNNIIDKRVTLMGRAVFNVTDAAFGAVGDGVTDDTTAIQAAITAASNASTGGLGRVLVPGHGQSTPYIISSPLTFYSNVELVGTGLGNTVIKLKANSNCDMITSNNFASLTGTNSTGGISNCAIKDITLDGNSANQSSGTGRILSMYGYYYVIENCVFRNAYGQLLYSEWSTSGTAPSPDAMEARIRNCKFHDALNDTGVIFDGPHDSIITDVEVYRTKYHGIQVGPNAPGTKFTNVHCWSQNTGNSACNWLIETNNVQCMNCYADSSDTVGVVVGGTAFQWIGGLIGGSLSNASATGIQIGQTAGGTPYHGSYNQSAGLTTAVAVSNSIIMSIMSNWLGSNGVIWFANDSGNMILAMITPGAGATKTYNGTPSTSGVYIWRTSGLSGAGNRNIGLFPGIFVGGQNSLQTIANSGTINVSGFTLLRTTATSSVTGVILAVGEFPGQQVWITNESGSNTLTMAASGTSHVANGTSCVLNVLTAKSFIWDTGTSLWYPTS